MKEHERTCHLKSSTNLRSQDYEIGSCLSVGHVEILRDRLVDHLVDHRVDHVEILRDHLEILRSEGSV